MTNNTEKIEQLLDEALAYRGNIGPSRIRMDSPNYGTEYAIVQLANAFSALAEAIEEMNKQFGDLAERLGD